MANRIDLDVPFVEKDEAKSLGASWDEESRVWWITEDQLNDELARWLPYKATPDSVLESLGPIFSVEADQEFVRKLSQNCEFKEWMLLMLLDGNWGAFWRQDLDTPAATAVADRDYKSGCHFISNSPKVVLDYMRENRLYTGAKQLDQAESASECSDVEEMQNSYCVGQLTVGGKTIEIKLPKICETLIHNIGTSAHLVPTNSGLVYEVFAYLDKHTPDSVKYSLTEQRALASEMALSMRVPLASSQLVNRAACQAFIDRYKSDFTMYRSIHRKSINGIKNLVKKVNDYVKWSNARSLLDQGLPWETIAETVGVKTRATVEKYASQATAAEQESPALLTDPLCIELVEKLRAGSSVDTRLLFISREDTWTEFRRERIARQMLRDRYKCISGA